MYGTIKCYLVILKGINNEKLIPFSLPMNDF